MDSVGADRCPTVLVVGAASRDLDPTDPRGWRLGGGVTYGAMAAARLGVRVRALIAVDREASSAHELETLARAGVEVQPVLLARGPVFENIELTHGRLQVCHEVCDRLRIAALPAAWRRADALVLAPVAGELGPAWARTVPSDGIVGLGWQGLLRRLTPGQAVESVPAAPSALLRRADIVVASVEDLRAGGPRLDRLIGRERQQLLITNRASPALYVRRSADRLAMRLLPTRQAVEWQPIGAGDVLLATWVCAVAGTRRHDVAAGAWRPLRLAMAAAAGKVEAAALADILDLSAMADRLRPPRSSGGG